MAIGVLFLAACVDDSEESEETVKLPEDVTEASTETNFVQTSFPGLFSYLAKQDSTFSTDSFQLTGEQKLDTVPPMPIDERQLQPFQKLLIYNADSSKAIDLYSYNYVITSRNGTTKMEEAGPDTEVALVDLKAKTRKRIFFAGPSYNVWDAKWLNANEIALAGAESEDNGAVKPMLWQVNLADASAEVYTYSGGIKADAKQFVQQKPLD